MSQSRKKALRALVRRSIVPGYMITRRQREADLKPAKVAQEDPTAAVALRDVLASIVWC